MKAIEVAEFGGAEKLVPVDKPRPEPGAGQVLIEVKAAGINFANLLASTRESLAVTKRTRPVLKMSYCRGAVSARKDS